MFWKNQILTPDNVCDETTFSQKQQQSLDKFKRFKHQNIFYGFQIS